MPAHTPRTPRTNVNFGAGPGMLPAAVLEAVHQQWFDYAGTGLPLVENSHRGELWEQLQLECLRLVREVGEVPDTHEVLLYPGGATLQFALAPLNLLAPGAKDSADYVIAGRWSEKAYKAAQDSGRSVRDAGNSAGDDFRSLPELDLDPQARYVHLCLNNTVAGTQWNELPDTAGVPLVGDMTSEFLSRPIDWARYDAAYAGAQKNLGISGLTVLVVRRTALQRCQPLPELLSWPAVANADSMPNTPPMMQVWVTKLMLEWTRDEGGIAAMDQRAEAKAAAIHDAIDRHPQIYLGHAVRHQRSRMNVVLNLPSRAEEQRFIQQAAAAGFLNLAGHRTQGGIRISLYNPVPVSAAEALAGFMDRFATGAGS